jgi:3-hydroxyacyl-[acyl-carrier-protein] dehydratase
VAIKNVTINEPFFMGHFPGHPIMPGVLVVEAMAQAGCILLLTQVADREKKLVLFTGIEGAKFRRQITPGDQLRLEVDVLSFRPRQGRMEGKAYVDGKLACEATLTCAVISRPGQAGASSGPGAEATIQEQAETVSAE